MHCLVVAMEERCQRIWVGSFHQRCIAFSYKKSNFMHAIQFSFVIDITAYLHSGTKQSNLTSICIKKLTRPREPTARTCMQSSFYGSK